jgi:hypothetical protein
MNFFRIESGLALKKPARPAFLIKNISAYSKETLDKYPMDGLNRC